jgi:hypothetical protein
MEHDLARAALIVGPGLVHHVVIERKRCRSDGLGELIRR